VGALCIVACFFELEQIITALILARILVQFVGQIVALFVLRRFRPEVVLPFRMWLYPAPALLALVGWLYVFCSPIAQPGGWKYALYAGGTSAAGMAAYLMNARRKRTWPFQGQVPASST
jgi:amino acid transporter